MLVEVANFLSACPELSGRQICVNYLAQSGESVSLELSGNREGVRKYADGGLMRGVTFTLSIRDSFGVSQPQNSNIVQTCERIEKWIEEQNLSGTLPTLEASKTAVSIGVAKRFEITDTKDYSARYEAQIELIYYNPA